MKPLGADDPREVAGYRVRSRLGAGGMGAVYLAYTRGGQPVALKVIRPEYAEDREFRQRFTREVEAALLVRGPYTAPLLDSDTDGTPPWLASTYVPGPPLSAAVSEHGPLPPTTVLQLVAGVAEALQSIHAAGVVHRDLKPSNVLLASDGPRVIDFGIARAVDATALTGTDVRLGTPAYMAPEQVSGRSAGPALDVFALGLLTHYAATGKHPFGDGAGHALLYRIVAEEPDLADCPPELRDLVARCLAKAPDERPTPSEVVELCREQAGEGLIERDSHGWLPEAVTTGQARPPTVPAAPPVPAAPSVPAAAPVPQPPEPVRDKRRSPARIAGVVLAALLVVAGATFTVTQLTDDEGEGGGQGNGGGKGRFAPWSRPLGDIIVAGQPITGSKRSGREDAPYQRTYTDGSLYSAVTGYSSQAYGASQLEGMYRDILQGSDDRLGDAAKPGKVITTIAPAVQKAAFDGLSDHKGAAVAIDPSSGEILGLVSTPSYDPTAVSGSTAATEDAWRKLNGDAGKPLLNRALRETYPPGSAFMLVVAAAALEEGAYGSVDEPTTSPNPFAVPLSTTVVRGDNGSAACENATLRTALRRSCDNVFAKLAADLGQGPVKRTAKRFGFGTGKQRVPVPVTESVYPDEMNKAQQSLAGLGQFEVRATPLQIAMVTAALANDGKLAAPHMVSQVTDADGKVLDRHPGSTPKRVVSEKTAAELRKAMVSTVTDGTGSAVRISGAEVGGKPGVAQAAVAGKPTSYRWFTSYATPRSDTDGRPVAVAVIVEEDSGGAPAPGIARRILEAALR